MGIGRMIVHEAVRSAQNAQRRPGGMTQEQYQQNPAIQRARERMLAQREQREAAAALRDMAAEHAVRQASPAGRRTGAVRTGRRARYGRDVQRTGAYRRRGRAAGHLDGAGGRWLDLVPAGHAGSPDSMRGWRAQAAGVGLGRARLVCDSMYASTESLRTRVLLRARPGLRDVHRLQLSCCDQPVDVVFAGTA